MAVRKRSRRDLTIEQQLARGPVDLVFLALVLLLTAVGLIMLLSASFAIAMYNSYPGVDTGGNPYYYFIRQGGFALGGIALMYVISRIDYQRIRLLSVPALALSILLLLLIFTPLGWESNGARRWHPVPALGVRQGGRHHVLCRPAVQAERRAAGSAEKVE